MLKAEARLTARLQIITDQATLDKFYAEVEYYTEIGKRADLIKYKKMVIKNLAIKIEKAESQLAKGSK